MRYSKPPLTLEQQADQLIQRGLIADRAVLIARISSVNYYRFSAYLYPFRQSDDNYVEGTTLEMVWRRYVFDRRLRLLVLDPIERIEVAVRTQLAYEHAHQYGAFGYTTPENLPNLNGCDFGRLLSSLGEEYSRSREVFAQHFRKKYCEHQYLPIWMAVETMTFGATLTLYRGVSTDIKKLVAATFGQTDEVFFSWLLCLNTIRNICAHHARLWNRTLGVTPKIPVQKHQPQWHMPAFAANSPYAVLCILRFCLPVVAPQSDWQSRLESLLEAHPDIPVSEMGFPDGWKLSPLWK